MPIRPFPKNKLGKFRSIIVSAPTGDTVEIRYNDLKLIVQNGQLCFFYESLAGDLIMPIARRSTIDTLFDKEK